MNLPLWFLVLAIITKIVPLNQIISLATLLAPLQSNHQATIADVIKLVIQEDNHPPLYFIFAYLWNKLFFDRGEYVSLEGMRSLAVFWELFRFL
jgi:uncharacterized membrane protein